MRGSGKLVIASMTEGLLAFGLVKFFDEDKAPVIIEKPVIAEQEMTGAGDYYGKVADYNYAVESPSIEAGIDFRAAAKKSVNSVVHVTTEYEATYHSDPILDFFWGPGGSRGSRPQIATGSGLPFRDR